jgi:hypothetical protein
VRSTSRCLFDLILNLCLLILKNEEANNGGEADKISLATLIPVRRRSCCWSGDAPEADRSNNGGEATFNNINLIKNQSF